ncbi:MAG: disulfide bond formation protein DsbA, partial [Deltaproteobacteria bacterium]|nr:disulfide bond formation protein DsbA [Deltaproteobacteria bacterium]
PEPYKTLHAMGLRALRVAAAVRKAYGNDGLAKIYTIMGTRYHHDEIDIDTPEDLKKILETGGYPADLATAAGEPEWDNAIQADMDQALAKVGKDVGVPLIVLEGGDGPGFFGPVCSPAPTGKAAVAFWDAIIVAGRTPGFYELKRTRETEPRFGKRPKI